MARSRRKREAPPAQATTPRMDAGPTGTPTSTAHARTRTFAKATADGH